MTNPYELFETDKNFEIQGIWIDYGSFSFLIARAGGANEKYARILRQRMKPYRRQVQNNTLDEELSHKILLGAFVDGVLLDWKDVKDRDGNALEYNRGNAVKLFTDLPDLFRDLQIQATNMTLFRKEVLEEDLGN